MKLNSIWKLYFRNLLIKYFFLADLFKLVVFWLCFFVENFECKFGHTYSDSKLVLQFNAPFDLCLNPNCWKMYHIKYGETCEKGLGLVNSQSIRIKSRVNENYIIQFVLNRERVKFQIGKSNIDKIFFPCRKHHIKFLIWIRIFF